MQVGHDMFLSFFLLLGAGCEIPGADPEKYLTAAQGRKMGMVNFRRVRYISCILPEFQQN